MSCPSGWVPEEYIFHRYAQPPGIPKCESESGQDIQLEALSLLQDPTLEVEGEFLSAALLRRRTIRDFSSAPTPFSILSTLLIQAAAPGKAFSEREAECAWGGREPEDGASIAGRFRYPYPVAGAHNILQLLLAVFNVEKCPSALYLCDFQESQLIPIGPLSKDIFIDQVLDGARWIKSAHFVVFIGAHIAQRANTYVNNYRLALLEAGHLSQNLQLLASSYRLNACICGAIAEDPLLGQTSSLLESWVPLTSIAMGKAPERLSPQT